MIKRWIPLLLLLATLLTSCAPKGTPLPDEDEPPLWDQNENEDTEAALRITEDYVIVADPAHVSLAERVQDAVKQVANLFLPIVTDGTRQEKEIILGDARCKETTALRRSLASPFLGAMARCGEKLVITDGSDLALEETVTAVVEELKARKDLSFPTDYRKEFHLGASLAKEVLTSIGCDGMTEIPVSGAETFRIFTPVGEDAWYYNHIPFMTKFKDRFYVFYNSAPTNEEDCGQRIMLATSEDGERWDTEVLVNSMAGKHSELVLNGRGCYVHNGTLTFFFQAYEYAADTLRKDADGKPLRPLAENATGQTLGVFALETTDGEHWTEPVNLGYIAGGNASPDRLQSGALLWAGHSSVACGKESDLTGGWQNVMLSLDPNTEPTPDSYESDFFQLSDGTVLLFSRTGDDVMLGAASFDDGATWTSLYRTRLPDYNARFRFGRLPDGRYYYLGNRSAERRELVLMTSRDGVRFDTCYELLTGNYDLQKEGLYKGGVFGYPEVLIDGDYMYVVYSLKKESMEILRIPMTALDD